MLNMQITRAETPQDIKQVRALFLEYLGFVERYLGQDLSFQGTDKEFADFPQTYDALFLAKLEGRPVGACGLKPFKPGICELKRSLATLKAAREIGYQDIYLDTDHGLIHANKIYESLGFQDIEKYYDNPMDSRFMGLKL